ncbi:MAG: STAS domain-containing protein [Pseudomonadota bacterium]|nr:STAS domain-containing protein [Pseudomonadota bacterium]
MRKANPSKSDGTAGRVVMLDQDLTIYHVQDQLRTLLEALAAGPELVLDLSRVGEIDTAGMQVLILAQREALAAGKALHIAAHSPATQEALGFFNLASFFAAPTASPLRESV